MSFFQRLFSIGQKPDIQKKSHAKDFEAFLFGAHGSFDFDVSADQAYDYYETVAPLATAVDRIVDAAKTVWPVISDGDKVLTEHPILDFLDNPGYGQTYEEFFKDYCTAYLLTNNAYLNIIGPLDRPPSAAQVIFPFNVMVEAGKDGYAESYSVTVGQGEQIQFKRNVKNGKWRFFDGNIRELIHQKGVSDRTGLLGRSPLSAIKIELEQRVSSSRMNLSFINNGARPSGALSTEADLTDDQYQRVIDNVNNKHQGPENSGGIMVFTGGKWQYMEMSKSPKDMDYSLLLRECEEATAKRFNVPIPLIRGEQMTLSNMQTSELAFWQNAVFQLLTSVFSTWTRALAPRFKADGLFLTYNPSSISAMQLANYEQARMMRQADAYSDNEIRKVTGFEGYTGGDVVYKQASLVPVGEDQKNDMLPTVPKDRSGEEEIEDSEEKAAFIEIATKSLGMTVEEANKAWYK